MAGIPGRRPCRTIHGGVPSQQRVHDRRSFAGDQPARRDVRWSPSKFPLFRQVGGPRCPAPCTRNPVLGTITVEHPWLEQDDPAPRHGVATHLTGFSFPPNPHPHPCGGAGSGRVNHIGWVRVSSSAADRTSCRNRAGSGLWPRWVIPARSASGVLLSHFLVSGQIAHKHDAGERRR